MKYSLKNYLEMLLLDYDLKSIQEDENLTKKQKKELEEFYYSTMKERILMEKDKEKMSYTEIASKLIAENSSWCVEFRTPLVLGEDIRRALSAKKPDPLLLEELYKLFKIENDRVERIKAYRYKNQKQIKKNRGRISNTDKEKNSELAETIKSVVELINKEGTLIEEATIADQKVKYEGEWIDTDIYECIMEEEAEKEAEKKLLEKVHLIDDFLPGVVEAILDEIIEEALEKAKTIEGDFEIVSEIKVNELK